MWQNVGYLPRYLYKQVNPRWISFLWPLPLTLKNVCSQTTEGWKGSTKSISYLFSLLFFFFFSSLSLLSHQIQYHLFLPSLPIPLPSGLILSFHILSVTLYLSFSLPLSLSISCARFLALPLSNYLALSIFLFLSLSFFLSITAFSTLTAVG